MQHTALHTVECAAPAAVLYDLVTDVERWPGRLGPCVDARVLDRGTTPAGPVVLVEIVASLHGRTAAWRSRRTLRPEAWGIDAEILDPMPFVAAMTTSWRVLELDEHRSLLRLEHFWDLLAEIPAGLVPGVATPTAARDWVEGAVHANSTRELADLAALAAAADGHVTPAPTTPGLEHARHTAVVAAAPDIVYAAIADPGLWPQLFPACTGVETVSDPATGGPVLRVSARQHGRTVTWDSRRTHHPHIHRIDYELPVPMPFTSSMRGEWRVSPHPDGGSLLTVDRWWTIRADVTGIDPAVPDRAAATRFVAQYVGRNATDELSAYRALLADRVPAGATS